MQVAKVNGRNFTVLQSARGIGGTYPIPDLDDLGDVDLTGIVPGDTIVWNGSEFVPGTGSGAGASGIWRPLMDGAIPGTVIVDGTTGEAVMGFGPA